MKPNIPKHEDYRKGKKLIRRKLSSSDWLRLESDKYKSANEKINLLNFDDSHSLLLSLYSQNTGRPANDPTIYIRSLVLMLHFAYTSVQDWVSAVKSDTLLQYILGTTNVPSVSCHYDFINRITGDDPHLTDLYPKNKNSSEVKKAIRALKLKQGDKWENYDEGDTLALKNKFWNDASCDSDRWTIFLEHLFNILAVVPSFQKYLAGTGGNFTLSGDGSALHIHSNPFGHHVIDPVDDMHTHRYTAPDADIGWDSQECVPYLGYTFYNIAWHSREQKLDLPMFAAIRTASQHDALTTISATAHMLDVNPSLRPKYFCHDSAADAAHLFQYLRHKEIICIIDWNPRRTDPNNPFAAHPVVNALKDEQGNPLEHLNERGVPVCACGLEMIRDGYDNTKMATKYRCPYAMGRIDECPYWGKCTTSSYGRVIKTYDATNYKLFGPVIHGSDEWKDIYKDRTCTERINNRVLNDYKVHSLTCRNGRKHFFFIIMACINIHLDAWTKDAA